MKKKTIFGITLCVGIVILCGGLLCTQIKKDQEVETMRMKAVAEDAVEDAAGELAENAEMVTVQIVDQYSGEVIDTMELTEEEFTEQSESGNVYKDEDGNWSTDMVYDFGGNDIYNDQYYTNPNHEADVIDDIEK